VRKRERSGRKRMTRSAAVWAATIGRTAREISFMEMRAITP
jgi:hypothetical protein